MAAAPRHNGADELRAALRDSAAAFVAIGLFSFFVNMVVLTGSLYSLQIYDRVLTSRSEPTLVTLTLLLIGGSSIPDSTDKLLLMLGGIPAFAVCFFHIAFFWHGHVRWRRRCHEATTTGRWLSLLLVFFAMIFVYPLQMVFAGLFNGLSAGRLPSDFHLVGGAADMRTLFACYGLAYACMAGTLTALFGHAARRAGRAGFDTLGARREMRVWSVPAVIGLASALVALLLPLRGWIFGQRWGWQVLAASACAVAVPKLAGLFGEWFDQPSARAPFDAASVAWSALLIPPLGALARRLPPCRAFVEAG